QMKTWEGMSAEGGDKVHELAVEVVKSGLPSDYRTRLLRYLDQLETKYGELPSILGIHVAVLHSQAAPRTPLASPWAGGPGGGGPGGGGEGGAPGAGGAPP